MYCACTAYMRPLTRITPLFRKEFEHITEGLADALDFTKTIGANLGGESMGYEQGGGKGVLGEVDCYSRYGIVSNQSKNLF